MAKNSSNASVKNAIHVANTVASAIIVQMKPNVNSIMATSRLNDHDIDTRYISINTAKYEDVLT